MTKKEEFEEKFCEKLWNNPIDKWDGDISASEVWQWVETTLKEEREKAIECAEEMCKKQKEICAENLFAHKPNILQEVFEAGLSEGAIKQIDKLKNRVLNSPLATEVKDGN